jgi:hypothetical protein
MLEGQVTIQAEKITPVVPRTADILTNFDADGDTYTNLEEVSAGSNPCDPRSLPPIAFPSFAETTDLSRNGNAALFGSALRLTQSAVNFQVGSVWFKRSKQFVQDGFDTTFQFQITAPSGAVHPDDRNSGGDGFAFVIQGAGDAILGASGGGIGYEGILKSLAVEFDTWWNNANGFVDLKDPNGNHISVQTRGPEANSPHHSASLGATVGIPNLSDGRVHTVTITYLPGTMRIFFDNALVLTVSVDLTLHLQLADGRAWVGFTAATGLAHENHDILSWSFKGRQ